MSAKGKRIIFLAERRRSRRRLRMAAVATAADAAATVDVTLMSVPALRRFHVIMSKNFEEISKIFAIPIPLTERC